MSEPVTAPAATSAPAETSSEPVQSADTSGDNAQATEVDSEGIPGLEATPEPTPEPPAKHKVKVDDREIEVDTEELKRGYQLNKASYKRFEEAAAMRRDAEQVLRALQQPENLPQVLNALGVDWDAAVSDYVRGEIQRAGMPPEERTRRELQAEREQIARERAEIEAGKREATITQQTELAKADFQRAFTDQLTHHKLPVNGKTIALCAEVCSQLIAAGYQPSRELIETVGHMVRDQYRSNVKDSLAGADPDSLIELLGDQGLEMIRKRDLERVQQARTTPRAPLGAPPAPKKETPAYIDLDEYRDSLRR